MDVALVVIDLALEVLHFAGAKRPLIYCQGGQIYKIPGDRRGIGGRQKEAKRTFTPHKIRLTNISPTTLYLFSDGFIDQFGGVNHQRYTSRCFLELLQNIGDQPLDRQQQQLMQALDQWQGANEQTDDILVMGVRLPPSVVK
ncbi:PP2C family protein-serine/threonine phosphatase [Microscilla marina]|uniref:Serine/threonine protein kinases n=1 Tax=Microscilla marina ATCC 23134 TaxID=313606 RepID=A1ZR22_MICM2|nr:SpoIIE family protein phosphatase [Microscilla marina]EAY27111.1 serine/threonine protein kinases [Microscilla marina ATCC 23134]